MLPGTRVVGVLIHAAVWFRRRWELHPASPCRSGRRPAWRLLLEVPSLLLVEVRSYNLKTGNPFLPRVPVMFLPLLLLQQKYEAMVRCRTAPGTRLRMAASPLRFPKPRHRVIPSA